MCAVRLCACAHVRWCACAPVSLCLCMPRELSVGMRTCRCAQVWDYDLEAPVYGSFTLGDDGTIFIGSDSRHLYALSPSGKLKWKSPVLEGTVWSAPAISDGGRIFLGVVADTPMYALWCYVCTTQLASGACLLLVSCGPNAPVSPRQALPPIAVSWWLYHTCWFGVVTRRRYVDVSGVCGAPRYSVNTAGKTMYAFNSRDGTIAWSSTVGADVYSSPVLHSNLVIFGNDLGQVLALKQEDGAVAWNVSTALYVRLCGRV